MGGGGHDGGGGGAGCVCVCVRLRLGWCKEVFQTKFSWLLIYSSPPSCCNQCAYITLM